MPLPRPLSVVKGACPHDCPDTCALDVHVRDGIAIKVTGSNAHVPTAGVLCTKVARYAERTYHPDRLLHPLRRVGKKGEGRFERMSWDEAISTLANRLVPIAAENPELKTCALYDPADAAQAHGAGPRYLLGDEPRLLPG